MFVEKRPNGTYRFGEWYVDPLTGKRHRASVTYTKNTRTTRKQAEEELKEKIAGILKTASEKPITVADAFSAFLKAYKNRYARGTYKNYVFTQKRVISHFGEIGRAHV